ncbi:MAG: hypothetical protein K2X44_06060 [Magnetospirillum sp.]|nr:hypothetical protein [Magnetospirillum sp.]
MTDNILIALIASGTTIFGILLGAAIKRKIDRAKELQDAIDDHVRMEKETHHSISRLARNIFKFSMKNKYKIDSMPAHHAIDMSFLQFFCAPQHYFDKISGYEGLGSYIRSDSFFLLADIRETLSDINNVIERCVYEEKLLDQSLKRFPETYLTIAELWEKASKQADELHINSHARYEQLNESD